MAGGRQQGAWVDATVLDGITPHMRAYHEETFGPVASIIRFMDVDEAVSIANDTEYGLAAAVFGRDVTRALDVSAAPGDGHLPHQFIDDSMTSLKCHSAASNRRATAVSAQGRHRRVHRAAVADDFRAERLTMPI